MKFLGNLEVFAYAYGLVSFCVCVCYNLVVIVDCDNREHRLYLDDGGLQERHDRTMTTTSGMRRQDAESLDATS